MESIISTLKSQGVEILLTGGLIVLGVLVDNLRTFRQTWIADKAMGRAGALAAQTGDSKVGQDYLEAMIPKTAKSLKIDLAQAAKAAMAQALLKN
jgi:hypothetical protein